MGFMTLADFRDELAHVGGGAGLSRERLNRYVNAGYFEVAGAKPFRSLITTATLALVDQTGSYSLPTGVLGVITVRNTNTDHPRRFREVSLENFQLYDRSLDGEPTHFAYDANNIYVHPMPDATYDADELFVIYRREPTVLSGSADKTVLPAAFDMAISGFSKYYMLQNLGKNNEARNWFLRANSIMTSRIGDLEYMYEGESREGVGIAWSESDMTEAP